MRIRRAILAAALFSISAAPALAGASHDEEQPRKLRKATTILLSEDHPDGVPNDPNALPFATPEWFAANPSPLAMMRVRMGLTPVLGQLV